MPLGGNVGYVIMYILSFTNVFRNQHLYCKRMTSLKWSLEIKHSANHSTFVDRCTLSCFLSAGEARESRGAQFSNIKFLHE